MDPLLGSALITTGGNILGGLGKMLFGNGDRERIKQFAQYLKGQLVNPQDFANQQESADWIAGAPRRNAMYEASARRLGGIDSGVVEAQANADTESQRSVNRANWVRTGMDQNQQVRAMLSDLYKYLLR